MDSWQGSELNKAKEILAYELTKLVHGEEEANKAQETAKSLFGATVNVDTMPIFEISNDDFTDDVIAVNEVLVKAGIAKSKGEGRRLIEQGGVSVDDVKPTSPVATISKADFDKGYVVIKKGKKVFIKVIIK